jgi:hypothetical protein
LILTDCLPPQVEFRQRIAMLGFVAEQAEVITLFDST